MKRLLYILLPLLFMACAEDEDWTTDASMKLTFSSDSISFDTLISTVPSSTKTLTLYNYNKKGIRLNRAYLGKGSESCFRVNVDGQHLTNGAGEDFQVPHRDSIVVRIEVTPPMTRQDEPVEIEDDLYFLLESGVLQRVHLTAGAQDAIFLKAHVIQADTLISSPKPIVIYDSLVVTPDAVLRISAGTRLLFHDGAGLEVYGRVEAQGTTESPVVFRGDRTYHMFDYLPYDNTPSRWQGIRLHPSSHDNLFDNCDIHSGCYGIVCDSTNQEAKVLTLQNSVIHNIGGDGLRLTNCISEVLNSQISNTLGRCVAILGGA